MEAILLGIDVGTTNVKALLATPSGEILYQASVTYPTQLLEGGGAEQDPLDWWNGAVEATRAALCAKNVSPHQVRGIGVSGQGCAATLIDRAGEVIRPAIIWMDTRSQAQCQWLEEQLGAVIRQISGKAPAPYNSDPSLLWLQAHEPQNLARAAFSLTSTAFVTFKLTGRAVANHSDASILLAYDQEKRAWSEALVSGFGLPRKLYPPLAESCEVVGRLQAEAAGQLGLPVGIPIIAGGEDTSSAALALGMVRAGQVSLSLGTAGTIYSVSDRPLTHPDLLTFAHVLPHKYLIGGSTSAVGAAVNWAVELLGLPDATALGELASKAEAGSSGLIFLPYLSGELQPINDGKARGVFFGLTQTTKRPAIARAVLEGTVYALAHNLELIRNLGLVVNGIRATGGPTQSRLWCQIAADVMGAEVAVCTETGASLGNALLAAEGIGLIESAASVATQLSNVQQVYSPEPATTMRYRRQMEIYRGLYPALRASFSQLDGLEC
jgi:xylulokinase